jgi:hypothetical protein
MSCAAGVQTHEPLKDPLALLDRDSWTVVMDPELSTLADATHLKVDSAARAGRRALSSSDPIICATIDPHRPTPVRLPQAPKQT